MVRIVPRYDDQGIRTAKGVQYYDRAVVNPTGDKKKLLDFLQKTLIPDVEGEFSMEMQPEPGAQDNGGQNKQNTSSEFEF